MSEATNPKKKTGLIVFTLLAVGAMVTLVVTYAGSVSMLYLKSDQVFDRIAKHSQNTKDPDNLVGKYFRIHGYLKPHSKKRQQGRLNYEFAIMSKKTKRTLKVQYTGILPDTFRDNAELVLQGKLLNPSLYRADKVFAKCPTKYKEEKSKKSPSTS